MHSAAVSIADQGPQSYTSTSSSNCEKVSEHSPNTTVNDASIIDFRHESRRRATKYDPNYPFGFSVDRTVEAELTSFASRGIFEEGCAKIYRDVGRMCNERGLADGAPRLVVYRFLMKTTGRSAPTIRKRMAALIEAGFWVHVGDVIRIKAWDKSNPGRAYFESRAAHKAALNAERQRRHRARTGKRFSRPTPEEVDKPSFSETVTTVKRHASAKAVADTPQQPLASKNNYPSQHAASRTSRSVDASTHRARQIAAAGFDPTAPDTEAELDAIAAMPLVSPEHVGSSDPVKDDPITESYLARAAVQVALGHCVSESDTATSAGNPPTEAAPVPTEQPRESNTVLAPATTAGLGCPGSRQPAKLQPKRVTLPEARQARATHGRDFAHMPVADILRTMHEQGADDWGVVWRGCERWALCDAVLLDAIDATHKHGPKDDDKRRGAWFIGTLRNKARANMCVA